MARMKGNMEEFVSNDPNSWELYTERLDFYFEANGIDTPEIKRAVLLAHCGKDTYSLIRSLVMPAKPSDIAYEALIRVVKNHFAPVPSEIMQRFNFHKRDQKLDETVAEYVAELRKLSEYCGFGNTLDNMLRDRLVCGLRDQPMQRRLLAEPELTLQKALDFAIAAETAFKNAQTLRPDGTKSSDLNMIKHSQQNSHQSFERKSSRPCFRCNGNHSSQDCQFIKVRCRKCGKMGHIQRACLSTTSNKRAPHKGYKKAFYRTTNAIEQMEQDDSTAADDLLYSLNKIDSITERKAYIVEMQINGAPIKMEVDSGCACSIISEDTYKKLWTQTTMPLLPSEVKLRTWVQENVDILGKSQVVVQYNNTTNELPLLVARGHGTSLLGRNWFSSLGIGILGLHKIEHLDSRVRELIAKHEKVFSQEVGCSTSPPVKIQLKTDTSPVFLKARHVPIAVRPKVEEELNKMVDAGILQPIGFSEWATPIVPVIKNDGSIRICGDYKATVNPNIEVEKYPLPTNTELFSKMAGAKKFIKLDLRQAYQQLNVDEKSARILTLNTSKGLFKMNRMPFGIASASAIFQRHMDTLLADAEGVGAYQDDVLIGGRDDDEVIKRADQALQIIEDDGLTVKIDKCEWLVTGSWTRHRNGYGKTPKQKLLNKLSC